MIICICHNVSDKKVAEILASSPGIHKLKDLKKHIKICTQCGKCRDGVIDMINENNKKIIPIIPISE